MAYHIEGNRILTSDEKASEAFENAAWAFAGANPLISVACGLLTSGLMYWFFAYAMPVGWKLVAMTVAFGCGFFGALAICSFALVGIFLGSIYGVIQFLNKL